MGWRTLTIVDHIHYYYNYYLTQYNDDLIQASSLLIKLFLLEYIYISFNISSAKCISNLIPPSEIPIVTIPVFPGNTCGQS